MKINFWSSLPLLLRAINQSKSLPTFQWNYSIKEHICLKIFFRSEDHLLWLNFFPVCISLRPYDPKRSPGAICVEYDGYENDTKHSCQCFYWFETWYIILILSLHGTYFEEGFCIKKYSWAIWSTNYIDGFRTSLPRSTSFYGHP